MEHALKLGLRNNIWTGGLPLSDDKLVERCADLARNGLISVHLSTIDPILYEQLHPGRTRDDIKTVIDGVKRLINMGYPPSRILNSVTLTGLQPPEDMIRTIDLFEDEFGIQTSLNVYHTYSRPGTDPGVLSRFIPCPLNVAKVYVRLARQVGSNLPMNCVNKQYCSTTVAVLCDGSVTPCATIREPDPPNIHKERFAVICEREREHLTIARFRDAEQLPPQCRVCTMSGSCFGCRARAFAAGNDMFGPDPRCFRSKPGIGEAVFDNNPSS